MVLVADGVKLWSGKTFSCLRSCKLNVSETEDRAEISLFPLAMAFAPGILYCNLCSNILCHAFIPQFLKQNCIAHRLKVSCTHNNFFAYAQFCNLYIFLMFFVAIGAKLAVVGTKEGYLAVCFVFICCSACSVLNFAVTYLHFPLLFCFVLFCSILFYSTMAFYQNFSVV